MQTITEQESRSCGFLQFVQVFD